MDANCFSFEQKGRIYQTPEFCSHDFNKHDKESAFISEINCNLNSDEHYLDANKLLKSKSVKKATTNDVFYYTTQAIYRDICKSLPIESDEYKALQLLMLMQYNKAAPNAKTRSNPFSEHSKSPYNRNITNNTRDHIESKIANALNLDENGWSYTVNPWTNNTGTCFLLEAGGMHEDAFRFQEILKHHYGSCYTAIENLEELSNLKNPKAYIDVTSLLKDDDVNLSAIVDKLSQNGKRQFRPSLIAFKHFQGKSIMLLSPGHYDSEADLKALSVNSGFVPSAETLGEMWLKMAKPEEIFTTANVAEAELAPAGKGFPTLYKSYSDFLAGTRSSFEVLLAKTTGHKRILAEATVALLKGLSMPICVEDQNYDDVSALFEKRKLGELLQCAYFRIQNALRQAVFVDGDLLEYVKQLDLINQEIQMILNIARPYSSDHLAKSITARMQTGAQAIIPREMQITVNAQPSCMRCISDIACSIQKQKHDSGPLNVVTLKDSYYESEAAFSAAKGVKSSILNGDDFNQHPESVIKALPDKVDLFLCEFHHNISPNRTCYRPENIIEQIKQFFKQGKVNKQLNVVIDTTINTDLSDDLKKLFLDLDIQALIADGKLNINMVRSCQKYDMLGFDNYYGGLIITVNNGRDFASFTDRLSEKQDRLMGINYQGICHLQNCAAEYIFKYQNAINENAALLYKKLPKSAIVDANGIVRISKVKDDKIPYLDIKIDKEFDRFQEVFRKQFVKYCNFKKLPLTQRASFGFANANYIEIRRDNELTMRLNVGLETPEMLNEYAKYFHEVESVIANWRQGEVYKEFKARIAKQRDGINTIVSYAEMLLQMIENSNVPQLETDEKRMSMGFGDIGSVAIVKCKKSIAELQQAMKEDDPSLLEGFLKDFENEFENLRYHPSISKQLNLMEFLGKKSVIGDCCKNVATLVPLYKKFKSDLDSRLELHHFNAIGPDDDTFSCNANLLSILKNEIDDEDSEFPVHLKLDTDDNFKSVLKVNIGYKELRDAVEAFAFNLASNARFKDVFIDEEMAAKEKKTAVLALNQKVYIDTKAAAYGEFVDIMRGALHDIKELNSEVQQLRNPKSLLDSTETISHYAAWLQNINKLNKIWHTKLP